MSATLGDSLAKALVAAGRLPPGPARAALLQALRSCADLARTAPPPGALVAALRSAMPPAVVIATEDQDALDALDVTDALGAAFNTSLAIVEDPRLTLAPPPRLVDSLATVARGEPRVVSIARRGFVTPAPAGPSEDRPAPPEPPAEEGDAEPDAEAPEPAVERGRVETRDAWRLTEGVVAEPPPVRLLDPPPTCRLADYYAAVVDQCLEKIAVLARDRTNDPFAERTKAEERILVRVDAILAAGDDPVSSILDWWARAAESASPWGTWAAVFALGCIDGADALQAVRFGLHRLPPDAVTHGEQAAEALGISRHPDRLTLAVDLCASPHPMARGVGVDTLARAGQLTVDGLRPHVLEANVPVVIAALRAVGRLDAAEGAPIARLLERWIHFPDRTVAWLAARALLRWGNLTPYEDLQAGGRVASIVGPRALDILLLAGAKRDQSLVSALVGRAPRTPALLSALGRFGHPGLWAFLLHQLDNEDLADAALSALLTLFGPRVDGDSMKRPAAWKDAIRRMAPDPEVRYRRGEPWRPGVVAAECSSGALSRAEIEVRVDELVARARVEVPIDLALWTSDAGPALAELCAAAPKHDAAWSRSGW